MIFLLLFSLLRIAVDDVLGRKIFSGFVTDQFLGYLIRVKKTFNLLACYNAKKNNTRIEEKS